MESRLMIMMICTKRKMVSAQYALRIKKTLSEYFALTTATQAVMSGVCCAIRATDFLGFMSSSQRGAGGTLETDEVIAHILRCIK